MQKDQWYQFCVSRKTQTQFYYILSCISQTRPTFLTIKSTLLVSLVFRSARLCAKGVSSSSGDEEQPPISLCHSYPMFIYLYVKLVCIFHNGCGVVMVCKNQYESMMTQYVLLPGNKMASYCSCLEKTWRLMVTWKQRDVLLWIPGNNVTSLL